MYTDLCMNMGLVSPDVILLQQGLIFTKPSDGHLSQKFQESLE